DYMVRYRTFGYQVGPETVKMSIRLDDQDLDRQDVRGTEQRPGGAREKKTTLKSGEHKLTLAFVNPFEDPKEKDLDRRYRALAVMDVEVQGPMPKILRLPSASYKRIMIAQPGEQVLESEAARRIVESFARRAFRRPVTTVEVDRFVKLVTESKARGES